MRKQSACISGHCIRNTTGYARAKQLRSFAVHRHPATSGTYSGWFSASQS